MAATVSSTTTYIRRTVEIYFTGDAVACARCPVLETYARKQCRVTGEYILDDRGVGYWCKLINPTTGEPEGDFKNFFMKGANNDQEV